MANGTKLTSEQQREQLKMISDALAQHTPLIKDIVTLSKEHERKMFNKEIFFGLSVIAFVGVFTYFGKLQGETLAGLIGVIIGYIGAKTL